jgi:hypothetical protein
MMRGLGLITLSVALLAAVRVRSGPRAELGNSAPMPMTAAPPQEAGPAEGCEAFVNPAAFVPKHSSTAQSTTETDEITRLVDPFLYGEQRTGHPLPEVLPGDMRIMIAMIPGPVHTHRSLQFDRMLEAIRQAAQDENYTYYSSCCRGRGKAPTIQAIRTRMQRPAQPGSAVRAPNRYDCASGVFEIARALFIASHLESSYTIS